MEIKDGKIEVANPYKDPDGNAISFENARVTQSFNENIALEYEKNTNIITVTGANRGRIEIMTEYDIPLHKGDKKVGELYITIYADNEAHQHTFGSWESDDENHWKECDCGARSEEASHTFEWIGLLCAAAVSGAGMTLFARKKSDKYYD